MQQGTANAIGAIAGLLAGKLSGDVKQVQQAKQQRMLGVSALQQAMAANPEYLKNPIIQQGIANIQQQAGTGELFKQMFLGGTPEMANADLAMLQNAIGTADKQRQATILNETYNPATKFTPADFDKDVASIFGAYGLPKQMGTNIEDSNKQQMAQWLADNGKALTREGSTALQGGNNGSVSYMDALPAGADAALVERLLNLGTTQQQLGARNMQTIQGANERVGMQQAGANQRTGMQTAAAIKQTGMREAGATARQRANQAATDKRFNTAETRRKAEADANYALKLYNSYKANYAEPPAWLAQKVEAQAGIPTVPARAGIPTVPAPQNSNPYTEGF